MKKIKFLLVLIILFLLFEIVFIKFIFSKIIISSKLFNYFILFFASIICLEVSSRIGYFLIYNKPYSFVPKIKFNKIYIEPHPYIPYVYKRNFEAQKETKAAYPLNNFEDYYFPKLISNNYRHNDGELGNRDIITPKPINQYRILCLGASTTGNYIKHKNKIYSYPLELEKILNKSHPNREIFVHNCGQGGWNSAEIMINFLLNLYDTSPDLVVIYHGYNDIKHSLTSNFKSDYSHSRRNLAEAYHLYKIASYIPDIPLLIYNAFFSKVFPYINPRYGITQAVSKGTSNIKNEFKGMDTYERNIEHIIKICKKSNIQIVLSTFAHYMYDNIKEDDLHIKYHKGVSEENKRITKLAGKYNLPLIDIDKKISYKDENFVDSIHFSPVGMKFLAGEIGLVISNLISNKNK